MTQTSTKKAPVKQTPKEPLVTSRPEDSVWYRNEVIFMGYLGRDPEMSYTAGGKALTKFSLGVSQGKDKDSMWLNVVCWEQLAEEINEYAKKGTKVEVRGRLTQHKYNDKLYHDVVADSIEIIERNNKATGRTPSRSASQDNDLDPLGDIDDHPF